MDKFIYLTQIIMYFLSATYFVLIISSIFNRRIKDLFNKRHISIVSRFTLLGIVFVYLIFLVLAYFSKLDVNYVELIVRCCFIFAKTLGGRNIYKHIK